jgi:hypothetical protein
MNNIRSKKEAIAKANRCKNITGESYSVWNTLSGFDVIPESNIHTAMGFFVFEN